MSALALAAAVALAAQCAPSVAPGTLLSVMRAESRLVPTAIHDNTTGRTYSPEATPAAIALASTLVGAGHSIDAGLGQVNVSNWSRLGLTVATVFEPCRNMAAAARVLVENYHGGETDAAQQANIRVTLAAYNAGPLGGANRPYVRLVETAAQYVIPEIRTAGSATPLATAGAAPPPPADCDDREDWHTSAACSKPSDFDGGHDAPASIPVRAKEVSPGGTNAGLDPVPPNTERINE